MIANDGYRRLGQITNLLLPGDDAAPAAADLADLDELLRRAVRAVGREVEVVERALDLLPEVPTWEALEGLDTSDPAVFEVLSSVCAGAYFMSPTALDAIGYPHGGRKPAPKDQIVDELETGVLDAVMEGPSRLREVPA